MMNYIGITIGPIIETLELTSTPAGLWGASYMFSCITRDICRIITAGLVLSDNNNHKVSDQDIVSPYFSSEKDKDPEPRGIGKYHDRVIFRDKDGYGYELAQMAAEKVKTELADKFAAELGTDRNLMRTYFSNYIQIHVTSREVGDNESPIIAVNDILDCLELSRTFVPQIQSDPILSLLDSEDSQGHNDRIRKSFMVSQLSEWQLRSGSGAGIRDLESIASCNALTRAFKYQYYYAVVQADGDNMGNYIKSFGRDTQSLRKFSQNCLSYTTDAADLIIGYGGVVIYAGGDDLLFLAPVINNDNKTLFQLLMRSKTNSTMISNRPEQIRHIKRHLPPRSPSEYRSNTTNRRFTRPLTIHAACCLAQRKKLITPQGTASGTKKTLWQCHCQNTAGRAWVLSRPISIMSTSMI